jgi:hypothetical protein
MHTLCHHHFVHCHIKKWKVDNHIHLPCSQLLHYVMFIILHFCLKFKEKISHTNTNKFTVGQKTYKLGTYLNIIINNLQITLNVVSIFVYKLSTTFNFYITIKTAYCTVLPRQIFQIFLDKICAHFRDIQTKFKVNR